MHRDPGSMLATSGTPEYQIAAHAMESWVLPKIPLWQSQQISM